MHKSRYFGIADEIDLSTYLSVDVKEAFATMIFILIPNYHCPFSNWSGAGTNYSRIAN